jgi:hypothetical protein
MYRQAAARPGNTRHPYSIARTYEHVIRNDDNLRLTREYILNNLLQGLLRQEQRDEELMGFFLD